MRLSLKQKAICALVIVAFSYSLLTVAVRLLNAGFGPLTQVYLRIGLGCLLTFIFLFKKIRMSHILNTSKRDWFYLFLMGSFGYGIAVDLVTLGALHTKLLNVAVISSTTPFFLYLFSLLVLRKALKGYMFFFLLLTFYGVLVLGTNSFIPTLQQFNIGDFYVLLFAIGLGVYILARKMLSSHLNISEISMIVMFIAFVSSFLIAGIFKEPLTLSGFSNAYALLGLVIGGVLNLVAANLENFAFKHINAVAGSQILLLENIFAPIFGYVFYQEFILPIEFFGALVVIVGVWLYIKYGED